MHLVLVPSEYHEGNAPDLQTHNLISLRLRPTLACIGLVRVSFCPCALSWSQGNIQGNRGHLLLALLARNHFYYDFTVSSKVFQLFPVYPNCSTLVLV
jgi:hypothetical protein